MPKHVKLSGGETCVNASSLLGGGERAEQKGRLGIVLGFVMRRQLHLLDMRKCLHELTGSCGSIRVLYCLDATARLAFPLKY